MAATLVTRCGSCGSTDRVRKLERSSALRCQECRDVIRGFCAWPRVDDTPVPVEHPRPKRDPDFVTIGEVTRRNESRIKALDRWRVRQPA